MATATTGLMLAGLQGNNGSTLASFLALDAASRDAGGAAIDLPGSIVRHGSTPGGHAVRDLVREPARIVVGGWDVCSQPWREVLDENDVLPFKFRAKAAQLLDAKVTVLPGVIDENLVKLRRAVSTDVRHLSSKPREQIVARLASDIDNFARKNALPFVTVIYSGSTEANVEWTMKEPSSYPPSVCYAMAALRCKTPTAFVNCAAQVSTSLAMLTAFDARGKVCVGNHDLSTGQTKMKRHMLDYILSCAYAPTHITSYNMLGNADGYNLSAAKTNSSKIATKTSMLDACRQARPGTLTDEDVAHTVRIDYVPACGDDKVAIDEYGMRLAFGVKTSISMRVSCPDTMLAVPLLFDLAILLPLIHKKEAGRMTSSEVSSLLSFYFKHLVFEPSPFLVEQLRALTTWIEQTSEHKKEQVHSSEVGVCTAEGEGGVVVVPSE